MSANAKANYTLVVEDDRMSPQACAGQMVWAEPDKPLMPEKMCSGQTIIRAFLPRDTGKYCDEIVVEELQPEPRVLVLNMDNVEHVHRIVAVGDPWPEGATATPKPPAG